MGIDMLTDYRIDLHISQDKAILPGFSYEIESIQTKFQSVLVRVKCDLTIQGRTCQAVPIKSHMVPGKDYIFSPHQFLQAGQVLAPSLSLPYALINANTTSLMFQNTSMVPMTLKKGMTIGRATMGNMGLVVTTGEEIDWSDLVRPGPRQQTNGRNPPSHVKCGFYNDVVGPHNTPTKYTSVAEELDFLAEMVRAKNEIGSPTIIEPLVPSEVLAFTADGREIPKQRSISEDELWKRIESSALRVPGERFDAENEDEIPPFPPIPTGKPEDQPEVIQKKDIKMGPNLTEVQKEELYDLIMKHAQAFSTGQTLGKVTGYKARIETIGALPPPQQARNAGPARKEVINQTIEQLLSWDVIEKAVSTTASPVVLVWQNNKWRFCVDFRQLNSVTVRDIYPILRSDYVFSRLAGKKYFSLLDALKGYHQVEIDERDRHKTAFISHKGLFQYKRLPFGLKNAPAQFQRLMDEIIGGL